MALNRRLGFTRFEADEYYQQALTAYKKGDFDTAYDTVTRAMELVPVNAEYVAARGFFQLEDGALEEASADFAAALAIDPYEMLAHYGRGVIAYKHEAWDDALAHFMKAYYADQGRGETLYYIALTYLRLKQPVDALNWMHQAQAALDQRGDKRARTAERWLRELGKLAEKTARLLDAGR